MVQPAPVDDEDAAEDTEDVVGVGSPPVPAVPLSPPPPVTTVPVALELPGSKLNVGYPHAPAATAAPPESRKNSNARGAAKILMGIMKAKRQPR
jgi:hypothetical protein